MIDTPVASSLCKLCITVSPLIVLNLQPVQWQVLVAEEEEEIEEQQEEEEEEGVSDRYVRSFKLTLKN